MKTSGQRTVDPAIGSWKLNLTKSTFNPGPGPRGLTVRLERSGEGERGRADGINDRGQPTHSEYTANYDGRDHGITGSASADTVSLRRIDATTVQRTDKKAGDVVETRTRKVSSDGKTLTVTFNGRYRNGRVADHVLVFDRQ
jgi:hypothetical protein